MGRITNRNRCQEFRVSKKAASSGSCGMALRLARKTINANGVHCQVWIRMTDTSAQEGWTSHGFDPNPIRIDR